MGALETAPLGHAYDGSARLRQMMLEVGTLERLARLAKRQFERQATFCGATRELGQHSLRIARPNLLLQAREGHRPHRRGQVLQVPRP